MRHLAICVRQVVTVICICCLFAAAVVGQTHAVKIDELMRLLAQRGQFNGSILVAEHGRVIYQRAFGKADLKRNLVLTPDTPVYLASLTKQFTAMAVMILAEQHRLSYDDPLSKYFPEFPAYAQQITIRHLLNHTSGIPDYVGLGIEHSGLTNEEVLAALRNQGSPRFSPGQKFEYSNSGYVLLALIVEKVSGESYARFLKEHVFAPLRMDHTFVLMSNEPVPGRARAYNRFGDTADYDLATYGEGGIFSSVADLFKWDRALYTERFVSRATLAEAFTRARLNDGSSSGYGFGWAISELNGAPVYSHAGRYGGFNTYIKRFPREQSTIIFLTNHDFKNMGAIGNALISLLHDQPYSLPKLSIAELLFRTYQVRGITTALQEYESLKEKNEAVYDFSESELNELGYELLSKDKNADALAILKLNAEAFPDSWNVYDGLGEAYMKNGNREQAIENYRRSLALNPNNTNAAAMLKKLEGG